MKAKRIKCSNIQDYRSSQNNIKIAAKQSDEDRQEHTDDAVTNEETFNYNDLSYQLNHQPPLEKVLNPKVRVNRIRCTDIDKYYKIPAEKRELTKSRDLKEEHIELPMQETEKVYLPKNKTDHIESSLEAEKQELSVEFVMEENNQKETSKEKDVQGEDSQKEFVETIEKYRNEGSDDIQTCNITIKASPMLLRLLENTIVTNPSKENNKEAQEAENQGSKIFKISDIIQGLSSLINTNDKSFNIMDYITITTADDISQQENTKEDGAEEKEE